LQSSVRRGLDYLRRSQSDGIWQHPRAEHPSSELTIATTALAALAFDRADGTWSAPPVKQAVARVRDAAPRLTSTTAISLALIVLGRDSEQNANLIALLADKLMAAQDPDRGTWRPEAATLAGPGDAATEFALLGLWVSRFTPACKERAEASLRKAAKHLRAAQDATSGGWSGDAFHKPDAAALSRTASALLALGLEHSLNYRPPVHEARLTSSQAGTDPDPPGPPKRPVPAWEKDDPILRGFDYLDRAFSWCNAESEYMLYSFWCVERVGMIYRKERIGGSDWYDYGAKVLVKHQQSDGSWALDTRHGPNVDTALALLFLASRSERIHDFVPCCSFPAGALARAPVVGPKKPENPPPPPLTDAELMQIRAALPSATADRLDDLLTRLNRTTPTTAIDVLLRAVRDPTTRPATQFRLRTALAARMRHMWPDDLRAYLTGSDDELRQAAVFVAGWARTGYLVPDLVPLLTSPDRALAADVYRSLKQITGQDFGHDQAAWLKWWNEQGSKPFK
jgi:hypothetical protein